MIDKLMLWIIYIGMPVVAAYHFVQGNIFLNTAAEDATGLERVGNYTLAPVQYLLCGKVAILKEGEYVLEQRFNYHKDLPFRSALSILSLPVSAPLGCLIKGVSFYSEETRARYEKIAAAKKSTKVVSNLEYYRSIGIPVDKDGGELEEPKYERKPGDEKNLPLEKALLKEIAMRLTSNQIPFWVDCGTCIGAYRYGGAIPWDGDVDIAILLPDFDNVMRALSTLDPEKYAVQDWSNRCRPKTYLRVYLYENHGYIDIYCFEIDPQKQMLTYILSNQDSAFMMESWRARESRFVISSSFDTIFPLKRAQFDGIEVFVPHRTVKYLQERYGEDLRPVKVYNEATGTYEKDPTHSYWQLPGTEDALQENA